MELANLNVLGLEDPQNRAEFLERQGILGFTSRFGEDAKRAEWENDVMKDFSLSNPSTQPVILAADDDQIHIAIHECEQKKPAFMELPAEAQSLFQQHIEAHNQQMQQNNRCR
jgi:hypothetical protein